MSTYKNILLYLSNDSQCQYRIDAALYLAKKHDSFIQVIYVSHPLRVPHTTGGIGKNCYIREMKKINYAHQAKVKKEFTKQTKKDNIRFHWLSLEKHVHKIIYNYAFMCDAVILSQHTFNSPENKLRMDLFDEIIIKTGCQGILVPTKGNIKNAEKHVVIAWYNAKETARALKHSLALLQTAKKVTLLKVSKHKKTDNSSLLRAKRFLEQHSVKVQVKHITTDDPYVGKVILKEATKLKASSIVMGLYSKRIIREIFFGSISRYIVSHTKVPLFVSH